MNKLKLLLASTLLAVVAVAPLGVSSASAEEAVNNQNKLLCRYADSDYWCLTTEGCDLSVSKTVSVNGAAAVEADTAETAAQAKVGDTLVWTITVKNTSSIEGESYPVGTVTVKDIVPAGLTVTGLNDSTGGTFMDGNWTFDLEGNLPATLTVTTTATTAGMIVNTASLNEYKAPEIKYESRVNDAIVIDQVSGYYDADSSNDSNSAYVNVVAPATPAAVTTPKAPDTGLGSDSALAETAIVTMGALGALGSAYGIRKNYGKQV